MMPQPKNIYVERNGAQRIALDASNHVGTGGEAEVFKIDGGINVVKIYKLPDHPDYSGNKHEQQGAEERIKTHQTKLAAFPKARVPSGLVGPSSLAYMDKSFKNVVGYVMPFLDGFEELISFSQFSYKNQHAVTQKDITVILQNLASLVRETHGAGIVVGDFNWNNVLVGPQKNVAMIDCDSMQWGSFLCKTFTEKFVDPLICDPGRTRPFQVKPHSRETDVYAMYVIAFTILLGIDPFGGIYKPSKGRPDVKHTERSLRGISVFNDDVQVPSKRSVLPLSALPGFAQDVFKSVFEGKRRDTDFNMNVLDLTWQSCSCGKEFAGLVCPCGKAGAPVKVSVIQVHGKVTFEMIVEGRAIVHANVQGGKLLYVYDDGEGSFRREDKTKVWPGDNRNVRFRVMGHETFVGDKSTLRAVVAQKIKTVGAFQDRLSMFDTSGTHLFFERDGALCRQDKRGHIEEDVMIGQVLRSQTLFWVGDKMGFGFYRAFGVQVAFVFDPRSKGINDSVKVPRLPGRLVDSTAFFAKDRCWFMASVDDGKKVINHCTCIDSTGNVLGHAEREEGDGSWLGVLRGKIAFNDFLLSATDEGLVRARCVGGSIEEDKKFPDTAQYVDSDDHLLPAPGGIYVVSGNSIGILKMS